MAGQTSIPNFINKNCHASVFAETEVDEGQVRDSRRKHDP